MNPKRNILYFFNKKNIKTLPNGWDILALSIVFGLLGLFVWSGLQMATPYQIGQALPMTLDPKQLPKYASFTVLRMLIALFLSLFFTLIIGTWAAKSKSAAKIIIPCIDILQSVPILGFLAITVSGFIRLFPNSRLGPECAAIFAIFTAQAWNMCLSFYQGLCAVPAELREATTVFQLSAWQRFWRLEVPFTLPGLLWNMMLSMSGSWVFLVASESIAVANQTINLPGIGSYLNLAILNGNSVHVLWVVITMLLVIFAYDQLFFRPILDWASKFTIDSHYSERIRYSWVTVMLQRTHILQYLHHALKYLSTRIVNLPFFLNTQPLEKQGPVRSMFKVIKYIVYFTKLSLQISAILFIPLLLFQLALHHIAWQEFNTALLIGSVTALRVLIVVSISGLIWIPLGVWIGLKPSLRAFFQPLAQFLAAFPANVLFPIVVFLFLKVKLSIEVGVLTLMLLGTQWYILFNVIAGTESLPKELCQMVETFGLRGWKWWKRFVLPGIFPYMITGIITAVGSAWNLSVVAEVIQWGSLKLTTVGLGAYIENASVTGNFSQVAIGMVVMCLYVLVMNYSVWQPLYRLAQSRYRLT